MRAFLAAHGVPFPRQPGSADWGGCALCKFGLLEQLELATKRVDCVSGIALRFSLGRHVLLHDEMRHRLS
jgi:hypothetical protein